MRTADVLKHFDGNHAAIARALGVGRAAVNKWGPLVPPIRAKQLHARTGGKLQFDPALYAGTSWEELATTLAAPTVPSGRSSRPTYAA